MADDLVERLDRAVDAVVAWGDATAALQDPDLAPLVRIAADLRHYPSADFRTRLRAQLMAPPEGAPNERRKTMTTAVFTTHVREGFTTVTPYLWAPDRGLADFLIRTFDAVETQVADLPHHGTHRELRVGNSMVMLGEDPRTEAGPRRSMAFHVFVDDVDAVFRKALAAGGESLGEPGDRPYGERSGYVKDAYGNRWYIASPLGPESFGHALRSVTPYLHSQDVRSYIRFLTRAFSAVEEVVHELPGGMIPYARARIGDAAVEFGTADPTPGALFIYVSDPDAVYEQALAAGAKPLSPPADQPSGDRIGFVEDPFGSHWYLSRPAR